MPYIGRLFHVASEVRAILKGLERRLQVFYYTTSDVTHGRMLFKLG